MQNENVPSTDNDSGKATGNTVSTGKTIYVHLVALFGALLVFVGAFAAIFVLPTMFSQTIAQSRTWIVALVVGGLIGGLGAAVLSYRATLKTYSTKR